MAEYIKDVYARMNKWVFWTCLVVSIALIVIAFFVPPTAVIDGSVLGAVGELFAFPALGAVIMGIEKGSDVRLKKGEYEIHVDNPDGNGEKDHGPRHGMEE